MNQSAVQDSHCLNNLRARSHHALIDGVRDRLGAGIAASVYHRDGRPATGTSDFRFLSRGVTPRR
jgi:hypothetical protein